MITDSRAKIAEKILCVDDEVNVLHSFRRTLSKYYQVYVADSAEKAWAVMTEQGPFAAVMSDFNMPNINGIEFLKRASEIDPDCVQIMLTGNAELETAISAFNETQVFRYLLKPCPGGTVHKVLDDAITQHRLIVNERLLSRELERNNRQLSESLVLLGKQKQQLQYELDMAREVFAKVAAPANIELPGLDYHLAPKETVGGDFLLAHRGSDGLFYLMLGDLTGHGLQSALAVIAIADSFHAGCLNGFELDALAIDINRHMRSLLPTGLFCAALLLRIDTRNSWLDVWQGGLPDAYMLDEQGRVLQTLVSRNLPLGIVDELSPGACQRLSLQVRGSLFACSDGLTEQLNPQGQMFSEHNLIQTLQSKTPDLNITDWVIERLAAFKQHVEQYDDLCFFNLNFDRMSKQASV